MVQHDLTAFCRPLFVIILCTALLASSHVEGQRTARSPRPGLWNSLFGAVVSSLNEHVKRQRAREAVLASSRLDEAVINDENSIQTVRYF